MNLVIDCSALVRATTATDEAARSLRARLVADTTHAPHLIDAEFGSVLRRMTHRGLLAPGLATVLLTADRRLATAAALPGETEVID